MVYIQVKLLVWCWNTSIAPEWLSIWACSSMLHAFTFTYPLAGGVVEAPLMTSQPVSSIFLYSPLPCGTWQTPGLSNPWCCLPISFSVCLVLFPLSLCLARWFWPDLMNGRHVHTTTVCVSWGLCIVCWILAQTSSLVMWSLYEMRQHLISLACILFCSSACIMHGRSFGTFRTVML